MRHSPGFLGSHLCLEADKRQAPYNLSRAQIRETGAQWHHLQPHETHLHPTPSHLLLSLFHSLDTPGCRPACFLTHGCSGAGGVPLCMRMRPHTEADSWGVPRARAGSSAAERGSYSCSSALGTSAWKISWRERQPQHKVLRARQP